MGHEPRNRAERRASLRKARRVAGAAMAASGAAFGTTAAVLNVTAGAAGAATNFLVTTTDDIDDAAGTDCDPGDNDCSLREAIRRANNLAGADTISFDTSGTFATPQTITLDGSELDVLDDLAINGHGAANITVDANDLSRVFYIYSASAHIELTISGLTVTGGKAGAVGGGFLSWGENLTLINSVITDNEASNGGGISAFQFGADVPTVTFQGTNTVSNNSAIYYGAPRYVGGYGGGLYLWNGVLDISGTTTFSGNTADRAGGGIYETDSSVTITGATTFTGNGSPNGGGIYIDGTDGPMTITGATFTLNDAGDGAAIYLGDASDNVTITNTTITNNDADSEGGGIAIDDTDYGAEVHITNSTISGNTAENGGGLYIDSPDGDIVITNTTIAGNEADQDGGGIYLYNLSYYDGVELRIYNTTISGNIAGDQGGGIEVDVGGEGGGGPNPVLIFNSTISGNTAEFGGAIDVEYSAEMEIVQSTITANQTTGDTGGILLEDLGPLSTSGASDESKSSKEAEAEKDKRGTLVPENAPEGTEGRSRQEAPDEPEPTRASQVAVEDQLTLIGTIVSANAGNDIGGGSDEGDDVIVSDHSLIGTLVAGATITDLGGTIRSTNPGLGPLANNGGPTLTHLPLAASAAIDAGPIPVATFTGNAYDQRGPGFARVINGRVEIGAVEVPLQFADFTG